MSCSFQDKEKLRKKLQKLFDKQEDLKNIAKNRCGINRRQCIENEMKNTQKNEMPEHQQVKQKEDFTKNIKKQKQSLGKGLTLSKDVSNQNGYVQTPDKHELKKSKEFKLKKDKHSKLQQSGIPTAINNNEKDSCNQQSRPCNTTNINTKKYDKIKKHVNKNYEQINNGIKNHTKIETENKNIKQNALKSNKTTTVEQSNLVGNSNKNIKKNQKNTSKKRQALTQSLDNESKVSKKKQKLFNETEKKTERSTKSKKKHKPITYKSWSSSLQFKDEHVNGVTGYVRGGDFDSDYEEHETEQDYWIQMGSYNDNEHFKKSIQKDVELYGHNDSSGCEEEYFDSDDEDYAVDDFNSDLFESEEENYSDFDEDDYEEDEDSYNYTTESECDNSSGYNDYANEFSYDFNDSDCDGDYELPDHIPEDLIIHKGTAIKRDLKPEDNVSFCNKNDSQIVEIVNQDGVKVIYQPKAYEKEELMKLNYETKSSKSSAITFHGNETTSSDLDDCPKLVPLIDEDGFQLYNPNREMYRKEQKENEDEYENCNMDDVSLGSEYSEINSEDVDSFLSEDINDKYLNGGHYDSDSDSNIYENIWNKKYKVDVIDATDYKCETVFKDSKNDSDNSLNDDIDQISLFKLYNTVDLSTESRILGTTVIENELCDKSSATQEIKSPKVAKSFGQGLLGFNTKFFNALDSNLVVVLLKDPFYIYGTVRLTLLAGTVEVYGHPLTLNTEVEIFSPRGCSVIEISSSREKSNNDNENLQHVLKTYEQHFALADLKKIVNSYNNENDAVVLLKRNDLRKKVVQQFKKFMNENVFPNINNINVDRPLYESEYLLNCMINTSAREQKCLQLPKQWQQLTITPNSRVMLAGGKSVGKSTLLRYLINRHLPQEILLIDLDIGQPEVFIPQTVSCTIIKKPLLGPGFFLNLQPEMSYAVGHTNIALCAHKYIAAVRSLIAHCKAKEEYKGIPWIINTMGYNKGFGLELISIIARELPLTDVVQLQSTKDINNFDSILHPHVLSSVPQILLPQGYDNNENMNEKLNYRLHVWQSAVEQKSRYQQDWEMSAKDMRFAMFLARLSEALQGHADWLTDLKPLSASLNELRIINLMENNPSASVEELAKSLEANLVYLCHYEDVFKPLKCLGIGVVRAVDFHVQQLYLIPALPYTQLKDVNCVAIGEMPLPTSLFTNQGPRIKSIAPFVYNTISANASKSIKQIYHRPRKFLTGKHKTFD